MVPLIYIMLHVIQVPRRVPPRFRDDAKEEDLRNSWVQGYLNASGALLDQIIEAGWAGSSALTFHTFILGIAMSP
jgi:hypothetical protein